MTSLDELEENKEKDNILISTNGSVNTYYLFLFLTSTFGRKSLNRIFREVSITAENEKNLYSIPVVLPELSMQKHIVDQAQNIIKTTTDLNTIVVKGENSIKNNLFNLAPFQKELDKFSQDTEEMAYQSLPFPIAVVYRKFIYASSNTQKFLLMIDLFESVIRFIVLVSLADYLSKLKPNEDIQNDIPLIKKITRPTLGELVQFFNSLARINTKPDYEPFLKEIKELDLKKYRKVIDDFVQIRNNSLKGHGLTLRDEEYEPKIQGYFPILADLISSLGFLSKYHLVKTLSLANDEEFFKIQADNLMGGVTPFKNEVIESRRAPITNKVIYFNSDLDYLNLDPFIVLEICPNCQQLEVLMMDKIKNITDISYIAPGSGHKPIMKNTSKLPLAIKQFVGQ